MANTTRSTQPRPARVSPGLPPSYARERTSVIDASPGRHGAASRYGPAHTGIAENAPKPLSRPYRRGIGTATDVARERTQPLSGVDSPTWTVRGSTARTP